MNFNLNELEFDFHLFREKIINVFGHLSILFVISSILCLCLYYIIIFYWNGTIATKLPKIKEQQQLKDEEVVDASSEIGKTPSGLKRCLLVIAHPDDECMFFGPTLLALNQNKDYRIFLLCLSKGESSF